MKLNPHNCNPLAALAAAVAALTLVLPDTADAVEPGPAPYVNIYIPAFDGAERISDVITDPLGTFIEGRGIERRTAVYVLPETAIPVIAEQHYRVGEGSASGAGPVSPEPLRALDKENGELIWSTAMAADRVIVKLKSGKSIDALVASAPADTKRLDAIAEDTYTIAVPMLVGVDAMLKLFRALADVEFAEPDYMGMTFSDPLAQWHLGRINADAALPVTGAGSVAVLDTGIFVAHPDLAGKIDTANGYNFVNNNAVLNDLSGHGTHVAGLISAIRDNGIGGRGVCPNVKVVPMRIATVSATGVVTPFYSYAVSAMTRIRTVNATGAGITVANHSWGGTGYSEALYQAVIKYAGVGSSTPPSGVTATWSNRSCVLELGGAAAQRQLIKAGMKIVTGAGLKAGSRCLFAYDHTGSGGAPTRMMVSDKPDDLAGPGVALTFESNPLEAENAVLSVAAAGNSRLDLDVTPIYPACLPTDCVVSVGGSTNDSEVLEKPTAFTSTSGSNYGFRAVDLFAPGMDMWSTYKNVSGGYFSMNGTSSAAALVSAAAALHRIQNPTATILVRKNAIIAAVATPKAAGFAGKCVSEGRLRLPAW